MSNGIYILKTYDGYRCGYLSRLEDIYGKFDVSKMKYNLIPNVVKENFGNSPVFIDLPEAYKNAVTMWENYNFGYLDDGIGFVITDAENKTFEELING